MSVILFDGSCNLCNGFADFVQKHDHQHKFKFIALQSEQGESLLKRFNLPNNPETMVYSPDEQTYFLKSSAALQVFEKLGGGWKILAVILAVLPQSLRDRLYDLVAKYRHHLFPRKK